MLISKSFIMYESYFMIYHNISLLSGKNSNKLEIRCVAVFVGKSSLIEIHNPHIIQ